MVLDGVIQQIEAQKHIDEASRSKPQIVHEHVLSAEQMQSQTDLGTRLAQSGIGFSDYFLNTLSDVGETVLKGLNLLNPLHAKSAYAAEPTTTMIDGIVSAPGKFKIPSAERAEQDMVTPVDALCNMIPNLSEVFTKDFDNQKYMPNLTAKDAQKFLALLSHIKGQKRAKMVIEDPTYKYVKPLVKALADQTGKPTVLLLYSDGLKIDENRLFTLTRGRGAEFFHAYQNYSDIINFQKLKIGNGANANKKIATYISKQFGFERGFPAIMFFTVDGKYYGTSHGGLRTLDEFYERLDKSLLHLPRELLGDKDGEVYLRMGFNTVHPSHAYAMASPVDPKKGYPKDTRLIPRGKRGFKGQNRTWVGVGKGTTVVKYDPGEFTRDFKSKEHHKHIADTLRSYGISPEGVMKLIKDNNTQYRTMLFDTGEMAYFGKEGIYVIKGNKGMAKAVDQSY